MFCNKVVFHVSRISVIFDFILKDNIRSSRFNVSSVPILTQGMSVNFITVTAKKVHTMTWFHQVSSILKKN